MAKHNRAKTSIITGERIVEFVQLIFDLADTILSIAVINPISGIIALQVHFI